MCAAAAPSPDALSIGELSRLARVSIETIRYYERVKMLPTPPRTTSGRRVYGLVETRTLTFIRRSRKLGFSLDQIRSLLTLSAKNGQAACTEVRELAAHHLAEVRTKIADLRAMARVLSDAVRRCEAGQEHGCPLLDSLSEPLPYRPSRKGRRVARGQQARGTALGGAARLDAV
jgi:MerR family mercuric resistance operon transcriptional regulator